MNICLFQRVPCNVYKICGTTKHTMTQNKNICRHNKKDMSSNTVLEPEHLKAIVHSTIEKSLHIVPGDCEKEKKEWVVKMLRDVLETVDNYTPVIGVLLDNPMVDGLETQGVKLLVDWAWEQFKSARENTQDTV